MEGTDHNIILARSELARGRSELALNHLRGVGSEALEDEQFWVISGRAHYNMDQNQQAVDAVERGLSKFPNSVALLTILGDATMRSDQARSERSYLAALAIAPNDPTLLSRYATLCAIDGQFDKARQLLQKASSHAPASPPVLRATAVLAHYEGDDATLHATIERIRADDPLDPFPDLILSEHDGEVGRITSVGSRFRRVASNDPQGYASLGRAARYLNHPLMAPVRWGSRIGSARLYIGFLALLFLSRATDQTRLFSIIAVPYLIWVVYSWVVPPLLRRWLKWRHNE